MNRTDRIRQIRNRKYSQPINRIVPGKKSRRIHWRFPRLNWVAILVIIGLIFGGWYVFGSGHFRVKTILIQGSLNPAVSKSLEALKGKNIVLLSVRSFEEELPKQQSSLQSLRIVKGFPDTLKINVSVREPVFIWKANNQQYYIDSSGVAFNLQDTQTKINDGALISVTDPQNQPVSLGQPLVPPSFVSFITQLATEFHSKTSLTITGISVEETTHFVDVSTDGNFAVKLDTMRTLDPQLAGLMAVLNQDKANIHQYVDLRVEGRAFYQ